MKKYAYLTIDDAPSKDWKQKVDYLYKKGIPAVFFCRGDNLEKNPKFGVYAIQKGFIIGNHSYNHPRFSQLSLNECLEQISKTDTIIENIYNKSRVKRQIKFFRFPFGDKGGLTGTDVFKKYFGEGKTRKDKIQHFLRELGYTQPKFSKVSYEYYNRAGLLKDVDWHWTYDVMEYSLFQEKPFHGIDTINKVFERMDENCPEEGRGLNYLDSEDIILFHDHYQTTKYFILIIDKLLKKGIIFKKIPLK